jgi:hypothetical protein
MLFTNIQYTLSFLKIYCLWSDFIYDSVLSKIYDHRIANKRTNPFGIASFVVVFFKCIAIQTPVGMFLAIFNFVTRLHYFCACC